MKIQLIILFLLILVFQVKAQNVYQEVNGLVVMEAENADFSNTNWEFRNTNPPLYTGTRSHTGSGYLEYRGANAFRNPNDNPLIYTFKIDNPGTYFVLIRGYKNHYDEANPSQPFEEDLNNDCWVKMDGDYNANTTLSGIKRFSSTNADNGQEYNGASKGVLLRYTKLFMSFGDWYSTRFLEYGNPIQKVEGLYQFKAGQEYTLSIVGRSFQFDIDRIYIFRLYDENGNPDATYHPYQPRYEITGGGRNTLMGDKEMVSPSLPESNLVTTTPGLPTVNLAVSANIATEADETQVTLNIRASSAVSGDQTVNLSVSGTGIDENDYTLSATTMTITNNQTQSNTVIFTIQNDTQEEGEETAVITLMNPSTGIALGNLRIQTITITDDDTSSDGVVTSLSEIEKEEILIYPNPTEDKIQIENLPLGKTTFILSDVMGNEIFTGEAEESFELDLSSFPTGVYTLTLNTSTGIFTKKIMKK